VFDFQDVRYLSTPRQENLVRKVRVALAPTHEPHVEAQHPTQALLAAIGASLRPPHAVDPSNQGHRPSLHRVGRGPAPAQRREGLTDGRYEQRPSSDPHTREHRGNRLPDITQKNKINTRERIVLMKYDPVIRKHVEFKETR
jgi:large subunit ribosomal protein L33